MMRRLLLALLLPGAWALSTSPPAVAFTFDDLPFAQGGIAVPTEEAFLQTRRLLADLKQHAIPAIGFVNEQSLFRLSEVDRRIGILEQWLDAGMNLGNHTFGHEDAHTVSLEDFQDAVVRGDAVTRELLGERNQQPRWFRHPVSHTGRSPEFQQSMQAFLSKRGYRVAPHTIENADVVFNAAYVRALPRNNGSAARIKEAYVAFHRRAVDYYETESQRVCGGPIPHILLIHANRLNIDALGDLAEDFKRRGYRFVSLEAAMQHPAYAQPDQYHGPKGLSWLQRWAVTKGLPLAGPDEPQAPSTSDLLKE